MVNRILRLTVFFLLVVVFFSTPTNADLFVKKTITKNSIIASTLDFSNRDTATNQYTSTLFSITGLLPGGYRVESLRLKKEGKIDFTYWLSVEKINGDQNLFDNLKIKILKNWVVKYEGNLSNLNININLDDNDKDDWIVVIGLDNNDATLAQKDVQFNLNIKTSNDENPHGFYVQKTLENHIQTGIWK